MHYSSFQVNFLDFEEEEDETSAQDEGVASIEDDDGIEGQEKFMLCDIYSMIQKFFLLFSDLV